MLCQDLMDTLRIDGESGHCHARLPRAKRVVDFLEVEIDEPLTLFGLSQHARVAAQQEYLEKGTEPFATNSFEASAFFSGAQSSEYPDTMHR